MKINYEGSLISIKEEVLPDHYCPYCQEELEVEKKDYVLMDNKKYHEECAKMQTRIREYYATGGFEIVQKTVPVTENQLQLIEYILAYKAEHHRDPTIANITKYSVLTNARIRKALIELEGSALLTYNRTKSPKARTRYTFHKTLEEFQAMYKEGQKS